MTEVFRIWCWLVSTKSPPGTRFKTCGPPLLSTERLEANSPCQVEICHPWQAETACLLCVFQKPTPSLSELNAKATGLPKNIANDPDAIVTDEVIATAVAAMRPWLEQHRGKQICSITSEAVMKFLSADSRRAGFAPAVPFVSCFSACMIVTELFRHLTTGKNLPAPRFQLNLLWGPGRGVHFEENRREDCFCAERSANINRVRAARGHRS